MKHPDCLDQELDIEDRNPMLQTPKALRGMFTAPHHLAAETGLSVLREGGNAIEAMVAAAATVAVVYPHMNSLGGDGFWLIHLPGQAEPIAIDACGGAGAKATLEFYTALGLKSIPSRGPAAANTVAGAVSGWQEALKVSAEAGGGLALDRLLEEAVYYAASGVPVTESQRQFTHANLDQLRAAPGFIEAFAPGDAVPDRGEIFKQARVAESLESLGRHGLDSFYRGELSRGLAADLDRAGCPVGAADLAAYHAARVKPLSLDTSVGRVFNLPPPTQGLASLSILGLFDRLDVTAAESFEHIHGLLEATKLAVELRDRVIADPAVMVEDPMGYLSDAALSARAGRISMTHASPWPRGGLPGDTIWMGAIDAQGIAVSFIQSIYWDFGSGVVLNDSGILWQNRGASFQLTPGSLREIAPGRKPFHTLNPASAQLKDGRLMVYGCMGGEGQPQTQSAIFTRYAHFGQPLQQALTAPRWLLGKTWGEQAVNLKLESRFDPRLIEALRAAGHEFALSEDFDQDMGHGGAVVRRPDGVLEGAGDPRSDGYAIGF